MNDLIMVGGGLANTLIALRLAETQPELRFLLLENTQTVGGNHTWSFHGDDVSAFARDWLQPLVIKSWSGYDIRFPNRSRRLPGTYHSISSEQLAEVAIRRLGERIITGAQVEELSANHVRLSDGSVLEGRAVIDGRGPHVSPHLDVRYQKFVGRLVKLSKPHGLTCPIIMDALPDQDDGFRFIYSLPFSENTLLIEDTRYSDTPRVNTAGYSEQIAAYAELQGWQIESELRTEEGILPITLDGDITAFWDNGPENVGRSGLRAALFHPATGYSLPNAVNLALRIGELRDWTAENVYNMTRTTSETLWHNTGFYRVLNRMLFLAAEPAERRVVLERFYGLNEGLIGRFYAGRNTLADKVRILSGKPPVGLGRAFDAVFRHNQTTA